MVRNLPCPCQPQKKTRHRQSPFYVSTFPFTSFRPLPFGLKSTLAEFCTTTGYRQTSLNLHLSDLFPAKPSRWFCVLTSPVVPEFQLRDLPKLVPGPVVGDFLPGPCPFPETEIDRLRLDVHEAEMFQKCGGLLNQFVALDKPLKTALHGWGNQLTACPCECRSFPLSQQRLISRGLFGALFATSGDIVTGVGNLPGSRHIHPQELACLHGMLVDLDWAFDVKLSLACLGQMASPVQSCWVSSQLFAALCVLQGVQAPTPEESLLHHFRRFHASVVSSMPAVANHNAFHGFCARFVAALQCSHQQHAGPSKDPLSVDDWEQNRQNSQRRGRNDLLKEEKHEDKQPATGKQGPEKSEKQPATETQALENQPADGTPGPSAALCVSQCTQSPVHAKPLDGQFLQRPSQPPAAPSTLFQSDAIHGGIPAFASTQVPASWTGQPFANADPPSHATQCTGILMPWTFRMLPFQNHHRLISQQVP